MAWVVDELSPNYQPASRARFSCEGCSGDVVPEKDLIGCWPLWTQVERGAREGGGDATGQDRGEERPGQAGEGREGQGRRGTGKEGGLAM